MLLDLPSPSTEFTQATCESTGTRPACWEGRIEQLLWRSSEAGIVAIQSTAMTYAEHSIRLALTLHNGEEGCFQWSVENGKTLVVSLQEEDAARLACWFLHNTLHMKIAVEAYAHVHPCRNPFCRKQHQIHEMLDHEDSADNYLYDSKVTSFTETNIKQWIGTKKPAADDICFPKHAVAMSSNDMVICKNLRVMDQTISISSFPREMAALRETRAPRNTTVDAKLVLARDNTSLALVRKHVRPTRVYVCSKGAVEKMTGEGPFGCVSYVWAQYMKDRELREELQRLSAITSIDMWWVDRWCIVQDDPEDKLREIPRMREYYGDADLTAVLMPDVTTTMAEIPQDTEIFNVVRSRNQNLQLLGQVCNSMWSKRLWTLQEGVLACMTLILTEQQCLPGSLIDLLLDWQYCPTEESAWATIEPMGPLEPMIHGPCAWWNRGKMCIKRSLFGREYDKWWGSNVVVRSQRMHSAEVLEVAAERMCTLESDRLYGIAGLIKGGDRLEVDYGMKSETLIAHAVEVGALGLEVLMTATVSQQIGRCWAPRTLHDLASYSGSWRLRGLQHHAEVTTHGLLVRAHMVHRVDGAWKDGQGLELEDWRGWEYQDGTYIVLSASGRHNTHIAILCDKVLGNIVHREKSVVVKAINMSRGDLFYIGY